MKIKNLEDLEKVKENGLRSLFPTKPKFRVGMATCGLGAGAMATFDAINEGRKEKSILVSKVGCIGACYAEPLVELYIPGYPKILYNNVHPEEGRELVDAVASGEVEKKYAFCKIESEDLAITEEKMDLRELQSSKKAKTPIEKERIAKSLEKIPSLNELEFFKKQKKIVMRNCGFLDPENIEEYIAKGGYLALHKALQMEPNSIIEEVSKSRLRGRGGAGFSTGRKWKLARDAESDEKYVVANGDEGDPGAYMDRVVLESDPHSMLEGVIIGAYAVGANEGFVFVRNEYPKAVERIDTAIQQAKEYGLLGDDILGSDFDFSININRGGGAFVCGEETALMASIEGKMPNPRPRPPYPTESGLWGKPTCINNVKTWANIPFIVMRGGDFFSTMGTKRSGGTKVFSLVGDVERRGLIEVELGTTIKEIVLDISSSNLNEIKAVQTGGPSGGFIPTKFLDPPLDYETLTELGSIMGSGGLVVFDKNTCMVDMARYFLDFTMDESCGQCTAGREGIERMLEILIKITKGGAEKKDLVLLKELAMYVEKASLCGLGKTAPRPVLTTLEHFGEEYKEHIEERKCRAGVCDLSDGGGDERN